MGALSTCNSLRNKDLTKGHLKRSWNRFVETAMCRALDDAPAEQQNRFPHCGRPLWLHLRRASVSYRPKAKGAGQSMP